MTAELVAMNRQAVALAADSAVTWADGYSQTKVFRSAHKVFALSDHHSIGLMFYHQADWMGVPWETVVKLFRESRQDTSYDTIASCAQDLLEFLRTSDFLEEGQENWWYRRVVLDWVEILENMLAHSEETTLKPHEKLAAILGHCLERLQNCKPWPTRNADWEKKTEKASGSQMLDWFREFGEDLPLESDHYPNLRKVLILSMSRDITSEFRLMYSGLVVAGFGNREIYPSMSEIRLHGCAHGMLAGALTEQIRVNWENPACIIPLAQTDMTQLFLGGIHPEMAEELLLAAEKVALRLPESLQEIQTAEPTPVGQKMAEIMREQLEQKIRELALGFSLDTLAILDGLPKDELGHFARMLVELTSSRRHYSSEEETVGGPVDVAVITKGDGLSWLQRKQAFPENLNRHTHLRSRQGVAKRRKKPQKL